MERIFELFEALLRLHQGGWATLPTPLVNY